MSEEIQDALRELNQEYEQFRKNYGKILEATQRLGDAGPTDDIHGLLKQLEELVEEVRKGGLIGSGAKGHREARERWVQAMQGKANL